MARRPKKVLFQDEECMVTSRYGHIEANDLRVFKIKARMAEKLADRISFATAKPIGKYDEAGRMIYELLTPNEVAQRACDMADRLVDEFVARGWVVKFDAKDLEDDETGSER